MVIPTYFVFYPVTTISYPGHFVPILVISYPAKMDGWVDGWIDERTEGVFWLKWQINVLLLIVT